MCKSLSCSPASFTRASFLFGFGFNSTEEFEDSFFLLLLFPTTPASPPAPHFPLLPPAGSLVSWGLDECHLCTTKGSPLLGVPYVPNLISQIALRKVLCTASGTESVPKPGDGHEHIGDYGDGR